MTQPTDFKGRRQELLTTARARAMQSGMGTGRHAMRKLRGSLFRSMADIRRDEKHQKVTVFNRQNAAHRHVVDNRLYVPEVYAASIRADGAAVADEYLEHHPELLAEGLGAHEHGPDCDHEHTEPAQAPEENLAEGIQAIVHTRDGRFTKPRTRG